MWTKEFWKATVERVIRGAAVAVFGAYFVGDGLFNALDVSTWKDVGSLALGGGFGSLLLALVGGQFGSGSGPSLTGSERLPHDG